MQTVTKNDAYPVKAMKVQNANNIFCWRLQTMTEMASSCQIGSSIKKC